MRYIGAKRWNLLKDITWENPTYAAICHALIVSMTILTVFLGWLRVLIVFRLLPVVIPAVTVIATMIVYLRLSCIDGATLCGNVTPFIPYQTPFQEFLNLWQIG